MTMIQTTHGQIRFTSSRKSARAAIGWLFSAINEIYNGQRALYGNHSSSGYDEVFEAPFDRVIRSDPVTAINLLR